MKKNVMRNLPYRISRVLSSLVKPPEKSLGLCFVTHRSTKGWILDTKCKRLSEAMNGNATVHYSHRFRHIPKKNGYFFIHYKYFARALKYNPVLWKSKVIVMFTHPSWSKKYVKEHMAQILNNADYVICLNSAVAADLEQAGVERTKIKIYHLASDPEMFTAHERRTKAPFTVGLSMRYYKRKNAELLLDIVKNMPDVRFMMLGVRWEKFSRFEELCRLNNFEYHEDIEYSKYPSMYHQMDVFLSTSLLEGGPVPLLEAMLSNVVPVVSNTGFANDIIIHGENGYIFDVNEKVDVVCQLIRNAFKVRNDVRQYVVDYSWKAYASKIEALFDT